MLTIKQLKNILQDSSLNDDDEICIMKLDEDFNKYEIISCIKQGDFVILYI